MKFKLISILICSILFVGCGSGKTEEPAGGQPIYNSDYKEVYDHPIALKELEKELEKSGVKLEEYESASESSLGEYYVLVDKMKVNIVTKINSKGEGEEIVQSISLAPATAGGTDINQSPFFNHILILMGEENLGGWLQALEEEYKGFKEEEVVGNHDEMADIRVAGRTYLSFIGSSSNDYKVLEIVFGNWKDIPQELKGVAAELENQGLFTEGYSNGFKGDAVKLASQKYFIIEGENYSNKEKLAEILADTENSVAYKVMYDPSRNVHYSTQLYGFIPVGADDVVKVEDMLGIDTISRIMDMSWDDFVEVAEAINIELAKTKELGSQGQFNPDYNAEGKVAGYRYELYAETYRGFYKFTVLLEKI